MDGFMWQLASMLQAEVITEKAKEIAQSFPVSYVLNITPHCRQKSVRFYGK